MVKVKVQDWKYFLLRLWLAAVAIFMIYYEYYSDEASIEERTLSVKIAEHIDHFQEAWCRVRRARVDFDSLLKRCSANISWNGNSPDLQQQTDAFQSFISFFDIRPAGQFSRFTICTKTRDGTLKRIGGDSWRVLLRGPATISPTIFDHMNGTYEVLFLAVEPGVYKLEITLDYSLCDGYRDPPSNWFRVGNVQGKMQKDGTLGTRAIQDFLLQPFQKGKLIMFNIPLPRDGGMFLMNVLTERSFLSSKFDLSCGVKCNFMWDGFGRWLGKNWKPYLRDISSYFEAKTSDLAAPKLGTLWIYGDSQAERLHRSIRDGPLCKRVFRSCNVTKLWVYPFETEFPPWDANDFDDQRIVDDLRSIFEKPEMNERSVMILNLGLHYMQSTSLKKYKILLTKIVNLLKEKDKRTGTLKYKARVIWKTSTSISKEKDTGEQLKSDRRRFLTLPRVNLYNSLATSLMCRAGLEVIDVYPFTRSYPDGTGGPEVAYFKEHDIVHFKFHVMKYVDFFLEDYFLGKVSLPINLENYEFC